MGQVLPRILPQSPSPHDSPQGPSGNRESKRRVCSDPLQEAASSSIQPTMSHTDDEELSDFVDRDVTDHDSSAESESDHDGEIDPSDPPLGQSNDPQIHMIEGIESVREENSLEKTQGPPPGDPPQDPPPQARFQSLIMKLRTSRLVSWIKPPLSVNPPQGRRTDLQRHTNQTTESIREEKPLKKPSDALINAKPCVKILEMKPHQKLNEDGMIERYSYGEKPRFEVTERVLMVVGATGAGKTTLINGMINYIFGVNWNDEFRYKMIVEKGQDQTQSVTQKITAYTIYPHEDFTINYTLTIVDTPGFGDTRGLRRDKEIVHQIREFFSMSVQDGGIDHLDVIGFVTQASLARLTPTQRYVFDSILSVFGKNVEENIFMMITFADGSYPPVVDAVRQANVSYEKYFKFNNSAIYPRPDQNEIDSDDDEDFDKMFWQMGMKSFKNFFNIFRTVKPQSLQLTNEVLMERQRIEVTIEGLRRQINEGLAKIDELHKENQVLKAHETDIRTNKNFTYTMTVTKQRKVDLDPGRYVTNCLVCNRTCHENCVYNKDDDKWQCSAMDKGDRDAVKCRICPGLCHWKKHVNNPYSFVLYEDTEERTQEDLKRKYAKAVADKTQVQAMIDTMEACLEELDRNVMRMIHQVQESSKRLDEIALKPNPLTEVEYIDLLIQSEKQEATVGWMERVQYYEAARQEAKIAAEVRTMDTPHVQEQRTTLWKKIKGWWDGWTT